MFLELVEKPKVRENAPRADRNEERIEGKFPIFPNAKFSTLTHASQPKRKRVKKRRVLN